MPKADLSKSYLYAGKPYGPGEGIDLPQEVHDSLVASGEIEKPKRASKPKSSSQEQEDRES